MTRLLTDRPGATSLAVQGKRHGDAALWFDEDIAASEAVPGTTDNDAGSWRAHLRDGVASVQEGVAHALARLAAFGDAIDPNGFSAVTSAQAAAGYAFDVVHDAPAASAYIPGNQTQNIENAPSGSLSVSVRTPRGVDARAVVIDHRRGENLVATYPRSSDDWDFLTQPDGSPHYTYWKLVDASGGSTIGISGVQAGDTFVMRVHDATAFDDFVVDQLPDVAGREDGNIVVLRRRDGTRPPGLYELETHPGDYYEGIQRAQRNGPSTVVTTVALDANPEGTLTFIEWTRGSDDPSMFVALRRSWFSANPPSTIYIEATHYSADGSAIADNNAIAGAANTRIALARDSFDDDYNADSYGYLAGVSRAVIDLWRGFADGGRIRFKIFTDSAYSTELVDGTTGHWNRLSFSEDEGLAIQSAIADLNRRVSTPDNSKIEHEIADLQDKTKAIGFDTAPQWADVGTDDGSRYGKFFLGSGTDKATAFGNGINYNGGEGFAPVFSSSYTIPAGTYWSHTSLAWVLPNDTTWDHLRIVATDPQGNVLFIQNAQHMRNVNNDIPVSNIPDDYTPRFMANEDRTIHTVGTMPAGTVLQIQSLGDQHVPIWGGEYKDGSLPLDAVEIDTRIQMERLITGLTHDIYKGRAHANYTVSGGVAVRRDATNVNSLVYRVEDDFRVVNTETEYAYLKRPTAAQSQDQDYEEISSLIVYDRDTVQILAAAPIRAVDPDPRFWQTSDVTITSVGTVFDFDYFEISYSARANQNIGVYFGQFIQWNRVLLTENDLAQAVRDKLNRNDRLRAEGAVGFAEFNSAGNGWLTSGTGISHSGTVLRITPQEALKSGRRGIMVRTLGGTPEVQYSEVFIPWSQFRSLDSNIVFGGNNSREIAQGILAGVTSPSNAGHTFFAQCQVTASGLELQLNVPHRNSAAIWIHFAS